MLLEGTDNVLPTLVFPSSGAGTEVLIHFCCFIDWTNEHIVSLLLAHPCPDVSVGGMPFLFPNSSLLPSEKALPFLSQRLAILQDPAYAPSLRKMFPDSSVSQHCI